MANIINYLRWRGDLPFSCSPLNEIDSLIFTQLVYLDFYDIVPGIYSKSSISLEKAAQIFLWKWKNQKKPSQDVPVLIRDCVEVLTAMMNTARFSQCRLAKYTNEVNEEEEYQFSAMKILPGDGSIFVAFRGTDTSLAGWKENFNMSYLAETPGQRKAVDYVKTVIPFGNKPIRFGGHSKGGNLAVFAALKSRAAIQLRLAQIYNFDGPGFTEEMVSKEEYQAVVKKIRTIIPQGSFFGMLLEREEDYEVVESTERGLMQHRAISWKVMGPGFVYLDALSEDSIFWDDTLTKWIAGLESAQRKAFVDTIFSVLDKAGIEDTEQLKKLSVKRLLSLFRAIDNLDEKEKNMLTEIIQMLVREVEKGRQRHITNIF